MTSSSPVHSLPPELLAEILCLVKSGSRRLPHRTPVEVSCSHVSRFWRDVALSTCHLWDNVDIYSYHSRHRANAYLHRSGLTPINLYIDIYHADKRSARPNTPYLSSLLDFLVEKLVEVADRIETFYLLCFYEETAAHILSETTYLSALVLRSAQLQYDCTIDLNRVPQSHSIFSTSIPKIQELYTDFPDFLPAASSLKNLTTLYLHHMKVTSRLTPDLFIENLTAMVNLQHLSLQGAIEIEGWNRNRELEMPNLRSLRLVDDDSIAVRMILSLKAPVLNSLWLDSSYIGFQALFDALRARSTTKFPSLRYLTVASDNFFRSEHFALAFPTITHIHMPYAVMHRHFRFFTDTLVRRWTSLHTIVLTMYKEVNITRLGEGLNVILPVRKQNNMPIHQLIVDGDYKKAIVKSAPSLAEHIEIVDLNTDTYREHWWLTNERERANRR